MKIRHYLLSLHHQNVLQTMPATFADKLSGFLSSLTATAKSAVKLALSSRSVSIPHVRRDSPLYILGNGPSLRDNIENDLGLLRDNDTLAVNFAANAPEFTLIRPKFYVLADPHFFQRPDDPNVARLLASLNAVTWPMTLFIPVKARIASGTVCNSLITLRRFNFIAAEGFTWFENLAFSHRRAMPRPRNVLIPSIMIGIWLGYTEIRLLGADHSWLKTISVDDNNRVVSIQPHFYKEDSREQQRIRTAYLSLPLHQVLESFRIAFRSYHRIRRFADRQGIRIINSTPGSFIDAFDRATTDITTNR